MVKQLAEQQLVERGRVLQMRLLLLLRLHRGQMDRSPALLAVLHPLRSS